MRFNCVNIWVVAPIVVALVGFAAGRETLALGGAGLVPVDVNDVSFLIPHRGRQANPEIPLIVDPAQLKHNLISVQLFSQVLKFEYPDLELSDLPYMDIDYVRDWTRWRVTSVRLNPCDDILDHHRVLENQVLLVQPTAGCQAKLRLVIQPFDLRNFPLSTALHLLYRLNQEQSQMMFVGLQNLKRLAHSHYGINTSGVPLMEHPGLMAELTQDPGQRVIGQALKNLVSSVLNRTGPATEKLDVITMTIRLNVDHWRMVGGLVRDSRWRRFTTDFNLGFHENLRDPDEPVGVETFGCNPNQICDVTPRKSKKSQTSKDVLTYNFAVSPDGNLMPLTETQILAEKIDQPAKTNFFSTNCTSCHISSNLRNKQDILSSLEVPAGVTPFPTFRYVTGRLNNLINFGYDGTLPRVSTRTAAESAAVAHWLNRKHGMSHARPPIENLTEFWKCLLSKLDWKECH